MDLKQLQAENGPWAIKNFGPPKDSLDPPGSWWAARAIIDIGRLAHAQLKADQGIRGSAEEHAHAAFDAASSAIDSLTGFLADQRYGLGRISLIAGIRNAFGAVEEAAELMEALTCGDDDKARDAVGDVTVYLANLCDNRGWDYAEIVESVWSQVKWRDWTKNKADGSA